MSLIAELLSFDFLCLNVFYCMYFICAVCMYVLYCVYFVFVCHLELCKEESN